MSSLAGSLFEKERQCPSSEVLLSYQQGELARGSASLVAFHLAECDFCSAELQLLSKYSAAKEAPESPPLPPSLKALAEALLTRNRSGREHLLENLFERSGQRDVHFDDWVPGP